MSGWKSLNNSEKSQRLRHLTVGEKYTFQQLTPMGERIFYRNAEYLGMGLPNPRYGKRIDVKMPGRFGRTFSLPLSSLDVNIPPFVLLQAQEIPADVAAADVPVAAVVPVGDAAPVAAVVPVGDAAPAAAAAAAPAGDRRSRSNFKYGVSDMIYEPIKDADYDAPPGMFDISDFLPPHRGGRRRKRKLRKRKSRKRKSRKRKSRKRKTRRRRKSRKRRS